MMMVPCRREKKQQQTFLLRIIFYTDLNFIKRPSRFPALPVLTHLRLPAESVSATVFETSNESLFRFQQIAMLIPICLLTLLVAIITDFIAFPVDMVRTDRKEM